jgi:hypothetical protein
MPEIGRPAPDFTLPNEPGGNHEHLGGFRGESNVVLLFFPLAWSSVCTRELCSRVRPGDPRAATRAALIDLGSETLPGRLTFRSFLLDNRDRRSSLSSQRTAALQDLLN